MSVLTDVQAQIARKASQITTAEGRQATLAVLVNNQTATPEEILEYNDLITNVIPQLYQKETLLNAIQTKFGVNVGSFGSMQSILDDSGLFSSKMSTQINNFNIPECTGGVIGAGNEMLSKLGSAADSLVSMASQALNDAFGDDLQALQNYINNIDLFQLNTTAVSDALAVLNRKFTEIAGVISSAMTSNPCMTAIADKLITFQSPTNQALYSGLKTAANDPAQKSELIKAAYDSIKL